MVVGILIYSLYCSNCELFKHGSIEVERGDELLTYYGLERGVESAYEIVREVCTTVGIPIVEAEISRIMGWTDDEAYTLYVPEVSKSRGFRRKFLPRTTIREWVVDWIQKHSIELPGFLIKSRIAKDRYINLEVALSSPVVSIEWVAARQVLREIARTAIEERLKLAGMYSYELQELLLNRIFPVNETGKPDTLKWIRAFITLQHLKLKR